MFDNLIALCPTCHTRYDADEIDRMAMRQYKANLSVLNARYGDMEKRLLLYFAENPDEEVVQLMGGFKLLLKYLLDDGFLREIHPTELGLGYSLVMGQQAVEYFGITASGREFIDRWLRAEDLEQT